VKRTATDPNQPRSALPLRRLRIVVADDDRDAVHTLATLLRDEGHDVHGVDKGDEVMRVVRLLRPDVVILDIAMPGQSGYAVAHEIAAAYYGVRKPLLIAVTGQYKRPADAMLSRMVGFDHHLLKPYDPQHLFALIQPLALPTA
jgi:DNA-binding response OmpR family regulator